KVSTQCTYYKLTIDSKVVMEIDVVNLIEMVNGVDLLEAQRKAIGR
ncbi:phage major tail tube protein, partial [Yersinia enterocolitica]